MATKKKDVTQKAFRVQVQSGAWFTVYGEDKQDAIKKAAKKYGSIIFQIFEQ